MYICVKCKQVMRCMTNGCAVIMNEACVVHADEYRCPMCGIRIRVANPNHEPYKPPMSNYHKAIGVQE